MTEVNKIIVLRDLCRKRGNMLRAGRRGIKSLRRGYGTMGTLNRQLAGEWSQTDLKELAAYEDWLREL